MSYNRSKRTSIFYDQQDLEELLRGLRNVRLQSEPGIYSRVIPQNPLTLKTPESNDNKPECSKAQKTLETSSSPASSRKTFQIPKPVRVKKNYDILIGILKSFSENTNENIEIIKSGKVYLLKEMPHDFKYYTIQDTFETSMRLAKKLECKGRKFHKIKKVCCPYLVAHFRIRLEKKRRLDGYVYESDVYHGTKNANIAQICKENFDWRKSGTHVGYKFGRGVSFAKYPTYATFYPKVLELPRVMLVTKIMYVRKQIGKPGMTVPDDNYDTTTNAKEEVIVKYDDAEFLPLYVIYYM